MNSLAIKIWISQHIQYMQAHVLNEQASISMMSRRREEQEGREGGEGRGGEGRRDKGREGRGRGRERGGGGGGGEERGRDEALRYG